MQPRTRFENAAIWPDDRGAHVNAHGAGILAHEGVYYWFGEHKIAGAAGNAAHVGVHVYASRDLLNWADRGIALAFGDGGDSPIARGCILERPKVIYNAATRTFVMWFHLEPRGVGYAGALAGVAVADAVTGPYRFLHALRPNAGVWPENVAEADRRPLDPGESGRVATLDLAGGPVPWYPRHALFRRDHLGGQMSRDMTLFVDDDGSAYHVHASEANGTLHLSLLNDDYTRPAGRYVRLFPGRFHEAPCLFKARGRYWLITSDCTGWAPNAARLSVADSIWGPWEELGNPCVGDGAHVATTFESQGAFVLPVEGRRDAFIFCADRWRPRDAIDGRYVWLPIEFRHGVPTLTWRDEWDLTAFDA